MKKKSPKKNSVPHWYPLDIYSKNLSAKELLNEICKRDALNNHLEHQLTQQQQEASFSKIIIENKLIPASHGLKKIITKPIKPPSVFEILYMAYGIINSQWFKELEDRELLESIFYALSNGQTLNAQQNIKLEKFLDIPWHQFQAASTTQQTTIYTNGLPVIIDIGIDRTDIITELRNLLNKLLGKKLWALTPDIFEIWQRKKIFAIFDLQIWFKINKIKYNKVDLGDIIWGSNPPISPNEDSTVNMKAFINDAIKESKKVIQKGTIRPLWLYCEAEMRRQP